MNITLIYFSQTGNTRRVAQAMAEVFRGAGHTTRLVSLKKASAQDVVACDLLGIGTPCFSSQAPTPIKTFLQNLPMLHKKRAFVFATSGGAPGRVLYDLAHLLQRKAVDVVGGVLVRGVSHHPAPCLYGRMPDRPNAEDLAHAQHFATAVMEHVAANRPGPIAVNRPDVLTPGRGFYDLVAAISTDAFLRRTLPEPNVDPALCTQCQWCVYECPTHTISLQPYPTLGDACIRCYRCLNGCPQHAFRADWRVSNLAVWAFYNTTFERWFGDLKPGEL
ncbi:EFR1 family ferrodoxin [Candidatus Oscillochloris fontis]|uniref:EFR1 family ferrodoxin n=1 Tax=Candidatus Oscillochloris fontis TaxID=2496868 RepID=UPI001375922F|nr:EFR1 family ferrodoxin [Candidatus Oscillochloris fontis]